MCSTAGAEACHLGNEKGQATVVGGHQSSTEERRLVADCLLLSMPRVLYVGAGPVVPVQPRQQRTQGTPTTSPSLPHVWPRLLNTWCRCLNPKHRTCARAG